MRAALALALILAAGCNATPPTAEPAKKADKTVADTSPVAEKAPEKAPAPTAREIALTQVLRLEHARALGDDKVGLPALAKESDVDVRTRAAVAIGRVGDPKGIDALAGLLKDEAPEVRAEAVFAAALIAATHPKDAEVVSKARALVLEAWKGESDGNDAVKQSIAWSLRKVGGKGAAGVSDVLGQALSAADLGVRREAMHSFALLVLTAADTPGIKAAPLINAIKLRAGDTDSAVSGPALYALMRLKDPAHAVIFKQIISQMRPEPQRALAIRGLSGLKVYAPALMRGVLLPPPESTEENPEPEDFRGAPLTQVEALRHIARLGDKDAAVILAAFVGDFLPALSQHGTDLSSPRFHVFLESVRTLPKLKDKDRAKALLEQVSKSALEGPGFNKKDAALGEMINTGLLRCAAAAGLDTLNKTLALTPTCTNGLERAFGDEARAQLQIEALGGLDIPAPDKASRFVEMAKTAPRGALTLLIDSAMGLLAEDAPKPALADPLKAMAALALASEDPVAVSLGVKLTGKLGLADQVEAVRAKLAAHTPSEDPGKALDVVLESIDALVILKDSKGLETISSYASSPVPAIRARSRAALVTLGGTPGEVRPVLGPHRPELLSGEPVKVSLHTTRGNVSLWLRPDLAPATVASFLSLAGDGFYNGLTFHRVIANFVVQGGDPRGDGSGGPGYTLPSEWSRAPYGPGVVGMAHAGKDTGGSQFFITHAGHPHLDGGYTVFGEVKGGMEAVLSIQPGDKIVRIEVETTEAPK